VVGNETVVCTGGLVLVVMVVKEDEETVVCSGGLELVVVVVEEDSEIVVCNGGLELVVTVVKEDGETVVCTCGLEVVAADVVVAIVVCVAKAFRTKRVVVTVAIALYVERLPTTRRKLSSRILNFVSQSSTD
jgi:hypothetical protein